MKPQIIKSKEYVQEKDSITVSDSEYIFFIIADGLGGHSAGELASKFAIEKFFEKIPFQDLSPENASKSIHETIMEINRELNRFAQNNGQPDMGTTFTGMLLYNQLCYSFHVGDTRLYHFNGKTVELLTDDHKILWEKSSTKSKYLLSSCIGGGSLDIQIDIQSQKNKLEDGSIFIITSDGIHDFLSELDLFDIIIENPKLQKASKTIISESLFRGSQDNLSLILFKILN
jgi:PPM family protein phosphatase